ncbi:hypothetical protein OHA40_34450 [Nocardia sp. NBC_00508]|uniref:hypothetical protein n=1 Tax=Nocardia sp. NBC_00508 TaxID=2975992 RepID=UPI002E808D4D|nr:hypothetical protein [Nocardia sp. NBC_00508]WUD66577.1 hypothetical protein OHA40_34450 [Nocardia sp. NBC_00508]
MDPVSVGLAAAVLLASKFGEGFAQDAGTSGWNAVNRLRAVIARKFRGDAETESAVAALEASPVEANRSDVAMRITAAARSDVVFAAEIERLVSLASEDRGVNSFVAQAFDNAKQANIRGDNFGSINL